MSNQNEQAADRRDFLKAAGAAGVGFWVASASAKESTSPNEQLNLALVGCGGRGGGAANDSLTINENVRFVATGDLFLEKCQDVVKNLSARHPEKVAVADDKMFTGLDAYKRVMEDPAVDVVLLATSPGFRPSHVTEAVQAGKHVFSEKPTCVDPAGYHTCLAAHDAAEKNGTAIVTGTQYRRQVNYLGAVKQIRDGAIGDVIGATTRYCSGGIWYRDRRPGQSDTEYQLNNWMHFIWLSGDQITEQAVHNLDAMNWVMGGPPETAYGSGGRFTRPEDSQMWDSFSIDYTYPGNRVLSFMCRQIPGSQGDNGNVVYGTKGAAYIGAMSSGSHIKNRDGKRIWSMKGSIKDAYHQEHKDLIDSIRAGQPIVELRQTADSSLTAIMGRLAAYTGQRVSWDFVSRKSKLDLFPKSLNMDGDLPAVGYAVPGLTKLV